MPACCCGCGVHVLGGAIFRVPTPHRRELRVHAANISMQRNGSAHRLKTSESRSGKSVALAFRFCACLHAWSVCARVGGCELFCCGGVRGSDRDAGPRRLNLRQATVDTCVYFLSSPHAWMDLVSFQHLPRRFSIYVSTSSPFTMHACARAMPRSICFAPCCPAFGNLDVVCSRWQYCAVVLAYCFWTQSVVAFSHDLVFQKSVH